MPRNQTEAIVLRADNIGELDKLVVFFTRRRGLLKGVAKGARKSRKRFGSSLERMSYVKVFYYEKEHKELVTVSDCDLIESFFELQMDPDMFYTLSYFAELIENSLPSRSDDDVLFRLMLRTLQTMKKGKDREFLSAYFETWFLKLSGFLPDLRKCKRCYKELNSGGWLALKKDGVYCDQCTDNKKISLNDDLQKILTWIKQQPPDTSELPPFSSDQIEAARKILKEIIIFHLERLPKSLANYK